MDLDIVTVGKMKELIKDKPDDAIIWYWESEYSEYWELANNKDMLRIQKDNPNERRS